MLKRMHSAQFYLRYSKTALKLQLFTRGVPYAPTSVPLGEEGIYPWAILMMYNVKALFSSFDYVMRLITCNTVLTLTYKQTDGIPFDSFLWVLMKTIIGLLNNTVHRNNMLSPF